jgi:hypothetical protein
VYRMRTTFIIRTVEKDVSLGSGTVNAARFIACRSRCRYGCAASSTLTSLGTTYSAWQPLMAHCHWVTTTLPPFDHYLAALAAAAAVSRPEIMLQAA